MVLGLEVEIKSFKLGRAFNFMYLEIISADRFGVELLFVRWILVGTLDFKISASVEDFGSLLLVRCLRLRLL